MTCEANIEKYVKEVNITTGEQLLINGNAESFETLLKISKEVEFFFEKHSLLHMITDEVQRKEVSHSTASSYYLLKNETGGTLAAYWLRPSHIEKLESGRESYIRNDLNLDLDNIIAASNNLLYEEERARVFMADLNVVPESCYHGSNNSARQIFLADTNAGVLYLDIEGIKGVAIDHDRRREPVEVPAASGDTYNQPIEIICEAKMSYERGQKEIIVRSNYQLTNLMSRR